MLRAACVLSALFASAAAEAQSFPTQRVTIVVPLPPGGAMDVVARSVGQLLEQKWKQPVVVDNRPGGALTVGINAVARAAPDGYTLLMMGNGLKPTKLFTKVEFGDNDLRPVVELVSGGYFLAVSSEVPAKTLAEFIAYAKARPRAVNYGTLPNTTFDLDFAHFAQRTGIQWTGVPYQGTPAAATALSRNEVQVNFGVPALMNPLVSQGKAAILAATTANRMSQAPNVPTVRELGVDFVADYSFGLWAPGRTPDAIVARIEADGAEAAKNPEVAKKFSAFGFESTGRPGAVWGREMDEQLKVYSELAQKAGIKPQ
jgi:tripartite-type tricarboxylate transporter receptor subunit TctC